MAVLTVRAEMVCPDHGAFFVSWNRKARKYRCIYGSRVANDEINVDPDEGCQQRLRYGEIAVTLGGPEHR